MGRHLSASNRRFAHVLPEPCVYAAELSNGIVKIGFSNCARSRMISLSSEVKRKYDADVGRFHIIPRASRLNAYSTEGRLIRRLSQIAIAMPGTVEYFRDIPFAVVVAQMEDLCNPGDDYPETEGLMANAVAYVVTPDGLFTGAVKVADFYPSPTDASGNAGSPATQDTFAGSFSS